MDNARQKLLSQSTMLLINYPLKLLPEVALLSPLSRHRHDMVPMIFKHKRTPSHGRFEQVCDLSLSDLDENRGVIVTLCQNAKIVQVLVKAGKFLCFNNKGVTNVSAKCIEINVSAT